MERREIDRACAGMVGGLIQVEWFDGKTGIYICKNCGYSEYTAWWEWVHQSGEQQSLTSEVKQWMYLYIPKDGRGRLHTWFACHEKSQDDLAHRLREALDRFLLAGKEDEAEQVIREVLTENAETQHNTEQEGA